MGPGSSTAMNDPLPTTVPRLDPTGSNWAIFLMCFEEAMEANQKWGHFNGKVTCPVAADPLNITADESKAIEAWKLDETVARYMLSQCLPDSTAVRLKAVSSVADRWTKVEAEFSVKSQYAETDLLTTFSEMCCPKGGNVWEFLGLMRVKREELAAVGVKMSDKEYCSAIIKSLPEDMAKFTSGILSTACMIDPSKDIDADLLIDHISEEADRVSARTTRTNL